MNFNKEAGQASRMLLVLAVIVLVAVIIVFLVMKMATKPPAPAVKNPANVAPLPVYEKQLGNIDFIFLSAANRGNTLKAADIVNTQYSYSQKDLVTPEEYIQVTIGAQNEGTVNTEQGAWDIGDIVDSQGRHFVADDQFLVAPWLPAANACGALLKPAFQPASCVKIYEVSKKSTGLKITVKTGQGNTASNFSSGKTDSYLLDLIVN